MNEKIKKLGDYGVFWITGIVYVLAFVFVLGARAGDNVSGIKYARAGYLYYFYPSRWNFYARSTSADKIYRLYKVNEKNNAVYEDSRPFTASFLYGLRRNCKIIFCETETIARDTALTGNGIKYHITMAEGEDINKHIHADTARYNTLQPANVFYLKGKYLVTIENQLTWQQKRQAPHQPKSITVIPINIPGK